MDSLFSRLWQAFIILMPNIYEPSLPTTSFASQTDFLPSPPENGVISPLSLEQIVIKNSAKTFLSHFKNNQMCLFVDHLILLGGI